MAKYVGRPTIYPYAVFEFVVLKQGSVEDDDVYFRVQLEILYQQDSTEKTFELVFYLRKEYCLRPITPFVLNWEKGYGWYLSTWELAERVAGAYTLDGELHPDKNRMY